MRCSHSGAGRWQVEGDGAQDRAGGVQRGNSRALAFELAGIRLGEQNKCAARRRRAVGEKKPAAVLSAVVVVAVVERLQR